ncbi:MAG: M20/M25/M40 family metallo-hydrolase, partial [Symbiobacteriaceae bacterium]|nr:M20/M25/M40 family metallo-hydrolase [Symbiobacteriaceae bacterium]
RFSFDIRHQKPGVRLQLYEAICQKAQEICQRRQVALAIDLWGSSTEEYPCTPEMQKIIANSITALGVPNHYLVSGAGHDSSSFMRYCPVGMIFVRTQDGISHNPVEYASPADCALGTEVLMRSILQAASPLGG